MSLFTKHKETLDKAITAVNKRSFYEHFPDHPGAYGENAAKIGYDAYFEQLNTPFQQLIQDKTEISLGEEKSPYTGELLGISYPIFSIETLIDQAEQSWEQWKKTNIEDRTGILIESLLATSSKFHEVAMATQHTTGQSYVMSFQASGPHAADRALEAIAVAYEALCSCPQKVNWVKPMGRMSLYLEKTFRPIPRGIGLIFACSSFPTWNTLPGLFANLMTGNPTIIKPHPLSVYPIALYVSVLQKTLETHGYNPHLVQLAVDELAKPIGTELAEHPSIKIIDFTGNNSFGDYLESLPGKTVFTEKSGVNSVIIDSAKDLRQVMRNLAFSVSMYSGQMCTAPQNFFIPAGGIDEQGENISYERVVDILQNEVASLALNPKMAPGILGAIQNEKILERAEKAVDLNGKIILKAPKVSNPEYANIRMQAPTILEVDVEQKEIYQQEIFGPVLLAIKTRDTEHSVDLVKKLAQSKGALTCSLYCSNSSKSADIIEKLNSVFLPVSLNFVGFVFANQHAAFSDFHGIGNTPAGNASYTNAEFVNKRFVWVGNRMPGRN